MCMVNNKRRLALNTAAEKTKALLHVVNVVSANSEFGVGDLVQLCGGNDHKLE